jgi:uncharacterized small protein (DUF1192 family)
LAEAQTAAARGKAAMMYEEPVRPMRAMVVGDNLSGLSMEDLEDRIAALRAEIDRTERELASKRAGRAAAEAVFGKR